MTSDYKHQTSNKVLIPHFILFHFGMSHMQHEYKTLSEFMLSSSFVLNSIFSGRR